MISNLAWLQQFYLSFCNGDWEHGLGGCNISNVDNPGWSFKFELADTVYETIEGLEVATGEHQADEGPDWVFLKKEGSVVSGACGPLKLDDLIGQFRAWVDSVEPQAAVIEQQWQIQNAQN
jgi:hypothetical protein